MAENNKWSWRIYVFVHGVFLVSILSLIYAFPQKVSSMMLFEMGFFVLVSVLSLWLLLQRNRWAIWLELLRILILLSLVFFVGFRNAPGFTFGYFTLIVVAVSGVFVLNSALYRIFSVVYEH